MINCPKKVYFMQIVTIVVTSFQQNARILYDSKTFESVIVDPGGDVDKIFNFYTSVDKKFKTPKIFLTHSHIDHAGGVEAIKRLINKKFNEQPKLYAHELEKSMRSQLLLQAQMFGISDSEISNVNEPDYYLKDGDEFNLGNYQGKILFTPGHSPGHLSLYFDEVESFIEGSSYLSEIMLPSKNKENKQIVKAPVLIAGDALFAGSIGRTDLPGGNHALLLKSIKEKLYTLPDNTIVLSGHGQNTTIGEEKRSNPFVRG